jgi:5'-deoxynucleotidase YfbR-like HD superfamily hydrolase
MSEIDPDILEFFLDRASANLPRWHTKPVIGARETADAHHFWTAWFGGCIARHLMEKGHEIDLIEVYEQGMVHDRSEERTGDIPGSFKREVPDARETIHRWEVAMISSMFLGLWPTVRKHFQARLASYLTKQNRIERQIVKFADVLTAFAFADEQIRIGNARFFPTRVAVAQELLERCEEFSWLADVDGFDEKLFPYAQMIVRDWTMGLR